MKKYIKNPDFLIIIVYTICFGTGIFHLFFGLDSISLIEEIPDICVFKRLTGYQCPGCGMTHAFLSLGRFQFAEAFQYNIFSICLFYGGLIYLFRYRLPRIELKKNIAIPLLALILAYGFARNLHIIS
jgi:hypothetical protein